MTEIEKAYIAGIIDGEGSIMLQRFHTNQYPAPCVSIASTTIELLTWLKDTIGYGVIIKKKNYNPEKHKLSYSFVIKQNNAIKLLEDIYPYLIIESKRKRAEMIITQYKALTPRNGRYTDEQLAKKEMFYEEFINVK
ncbi:hypothetical protein IO99_06040 [Clostridium sulfidigenes]|uniref:Homing endonuclease LAGLIDADG domain-containing protein n=1 Tax=Clostridium sulfidigenes TaxID=318464 RepID=A0A084JEJ1_9CLOT|nr:LAGLIDADG family homing endonuclease [Clostridium sulfidigenes]KEZ87375.1 hypothetical protein IO99_06040 [Clostridium sulfidigenes]